MLIPLLMALSAAAQDESVTAAPPPLLLGQLLGTQGTLKVRVGGWFANLSRGPNQRSFDSVYDAIGAEAPGRNIGRGTGLLRDIGLQLTYGDYDFALSFLSDQLLSGATDTGDPISSAVLRQILGQLRTRALQGLVGAPVWARLTSGRFRGPFDGSRFQILDGETYFGSRNDTWSNSYLAVELGAEKKAFFDLFDGMYLRYLRFGVAHALEFADQDTDGPGVLQSSVVNALGFGLTYQPEARWDNFMVRLFLAAIPFTGIAAISYGEWGSIYGLLATGDARLELSYRIQVANVLAIRPLVAFQAELVVPFTGSYDLEAEGRPSVVIPDYFFWGPLVGVEVEL